MIKYLLIIILYSSSANSRDIELYRTSISTDIHASFMNHVVYDPSTIKIEKCDVKFEDRLINETVTVPIDLSTIYTPIQQVKNNSVSTRIKPMGHGTCGFILTNFLKTDPLTFTFWIKYHKNVEELTVTRKFDISIYDIPDPVNSTLVVDLGDTITITCGKRSTEKRCSLYNPSGGLVGHSTHCSHEIDRVAMSDIGKWMCQSGFAQKMEPNIEFVHVVLYDGWKLKTWYKEDNGLGLIGCEYINNYKKGEQACPSFCQLIRPDNYILTISKFNGATERYTSIGTNLTNYICQLEFPLPLNSNEKGSWQCLIDKIGGYIITESSLLIDRNYAKQKTLLAVPGSSADIFCRVPYNTEDCYIQAPNKTIFTGGTSTDFSYGICSHHIDYMNHSDFGEWTCHYSKLFSVEDELIVISVKEFQNITAETDYVIAKSGDKVKLLCQLSSPIMNCVFRDGNGNSYHVSSQKKSANMRYAGRGYEHGECGMIIENVRQEHNGTWQCMMRQRLPPKIWKKEMASTKIVLIVEDANTTFMATTLGISIGVGVLIIVAGGMLAYRFAKRNRIQEEPSVLTPLNIISHGTDINFETTF